MKINTNKIIQNHFFQHLEVIKKTYSNLFFQINKAADLMALSIKKKAQFFGVVTVEVPLTVCIFLLS